MEFETLKRNHLKRNIIIGVVVVGIISACILTFTRARYRTTESIPLVTGTINYSPYDIRVSTKLLIEEDEYIELDHIPTSEGVSLISSSCTNGAVISWNEEKKGYEIGNLTSNGTKCETIYGVIDEEDIFEFDYTGTIEEFVTPQDGKYLLEVWGAQGGDTNDYIGGYGGYSKGEINLKKEDKLYIAVGGEGLSNCVSQDCAGGYNGGGNGGAYTADAANYQSGGGGATHIAKSTGLLSTLSDKQDDILIVAGGGSGAYYHPNGVDYSTNGVSGGGYLGNDGVVTNYGMTAGGGGTQEAGGAAGYRGNPGVFGQGGSGLSGSTLGGASGGGGGFYGGGAAGHSSAGGGSGYIGNKELTNKAMYCYNCKESSSENTLTFSINSVSNEALINNAKEGNGFARITLLEYSGYQPNFGLEAKMNGQNIVVTVTPNEDNLFEISKYYYTINDEYIESDSNTYTFENLEEGDYTVKVYVVDSKGLKSKVKTQTMSLIKGKTATDIINSHTILTRNDFGSILDTDTTGTMYQAEDDDGTTYYFAGSVDDNWVKFAGIYWRIVRVNGDGSIRLIYSGDGWPYVRGVETQVTLATYNVNSNDSWYVGYKYKNGDVHGLENDSTIKQAVEEWYKSRILDKGYDQSVDLNAGFCGDRSLYIGNGLDGEQTVYVGANRLAYNKKPSFRCGDSRDLFTVSSSNKGNKALIYPVGLITADEISYAGGVDAQINTGFYFYTNQSYWTMTAYHFDFSAATNFYMESRGSLTWSSVNNAYGFRPVINLKADTQFKIDGNGTSTNPYVVIGAE